MLINEHQVVRRGVEFDLSIASVQLPILAYNIAFFREPTFSLSFSFSPVDLVDPVDPGPGPTPAKIST